MKTNMVIYLILLAIAFCAWLDFVRHGRGWLWIQSLVESRRPGIRCASRFLMLVFLTSAVFFGVGPHWMDSPFVFIIISCISAAHALGGSDVQGKEQGLAGHRAGASLWSVPTKYAGTLAAMLVIVCVILTLLFLSDREDKWLLENPVFWGTSLASLCCLLFLCVIAGVLLSVYQRRLYSGVMSFLLLVPLFTMSLLSLYRPPEKLFRLSVYESTYYFAILPFLSLALIMVVLCMGCLVGSKSAGRSGGTILNSGSK